MNETKLNARKVALFARSADIILSPMAKIPIRCEIESIARPKMGVDDPEKISKTKQKLLLNICNLTFRDFIQRFKSHNVTNLLSELAKINPERVSLDKR